MIGSRVSSSRRVKREIDSLPTAPSGTGPVPSAVIVTSAVPGGAGIAVITWPRPTMKADGTTLPAGDISHYVLRRYSTVGALLATTNVGNVLTSSPSGLSAGSYDFTVACVSGYGEGEESFKHRVTVS
jgi:hypothetical protein